MSSIDERVVSMKFDNAQFEQGIKTTLGSLDNLNKGLKLDGATKGLENISSAASRVSLAGLADGINTIADKFKAMSVIGLTVLTNLTAKALQVGTQLVKSFTLDPIMQGLDVYETKINAIQTILANTSSAGTNLSQVTAALNELNTYANQTVFSFADMTKNIGTFTAAGVGLKDSVASIKGIANLAALSGSGAEQASVAMYQLSQAIAAGKVGLQDWNSVVNAGLGGKVFQDALINTARAQGISVDAMIKKNGSFRQSLQDGWITSKVLTDTLAQFTGDLSAAQLKSMGFTAQQAAGILKLGQAAVDSAVKIRTVTQLQAALREEVATAWSTVWETLIGNITSATTLLSSIHTVLENAFTAPVYALNTLLKGWVALGGRDLAIKAISNALKNLAAILKPIKDAFRQVFPPTTAQQLFNITVALEKFSEKLKIGATTANEIKRTFAGVFSVLGIGWDIVKAGAKFLEQLFGAATKGSGGFLSATAKIGDFLVALKASIEQGKGLELFFTRLGNFLTPPLQLIGKLGQAIENLFKKFDPNAAAKDVTGIVAKLEPITRIGDLIAVIWGAAVHGIEKAWTVFLPIADKIGNFFHNFANWVTGGFVSIDWGTVLSGINTGLFAGLVLLVKHFFDKVKGGKSVETGFLDVIKESFDQLTKSLSAMQNTLRAATLLEIAAALGILTISVVALSHIDAAGLTRALTAMTVMFTQLFTSMAIFEKISGSKGFLKMPLVTGSMILLAIAVDLLTIAVKNLSQLDWNALAKGLTGLSIILAALVVTVQLMPNDAKMIGTSLGLIVLAAAIKILVSAVTDLSGLSWSEMAKGLSGVAGLLVSLALFTKFAEADKAGVLQGAGLILLAVGIKILASAIKDMSGLSWTEIGKGLATLAGSLAIITAALILIPPTAPLAALAVLGMAVSLGLIAKALEVMAKFSWAEIGKSLTLLLGALTIIAAALFVIPPTAPLSAEAILITSIALLQIAKVLGAFAQFSWTEIAKSLVLLAGGLGIITAAMLLSEGALPGAAAILVVAASLAILAPVLQMFGQMSWEEMGKGLLMLAGVFAVLGLAGLLLTPLVPTLLGLGLAVILLGAGMLLAGAGVLAFSIGLTALSVAGAAGAVAIVAIVSALLGLLPEVAKELGLAIIAFAQVIATAGPAILGAITAVLLALLQAIIDVTPKIVEALVLLITVMLKALVDLTPKLVEAGLKILLAILTGIANNIGQIVTKATDIVVNFINAISNNIPRVIQAGVNLILNFINGLADAARNNGKAMGDAGANLATGIIEGMIRGLGAGVGKIADAAKNAAKSALDAAKRFLGISSPSKEFMKLGQFSGEGMAIGLDSMSDAVAKSADGVGRSALDSMRKSLSGLSNVVSGEMNLNPIVTPVLDLTDLKKNTGQIDAVLAGVKPISISASLNSAKNASVGILSNQATAGASNTTPGPPDAGVTFIQNNTSPKALSTADIYRQTKNQLSTAKGALTP